MIKKLGFAVASILTISLLAHAQAPSTVTGDGFLVGITSGTYPLASYGYSIFLPANSGNSYQIIGIYGVANNSGTYSYSPSGRVGLASIDDITDDVTEQVDLTFNSSTQGSFSDATITPPGYSQNGNFVGAIGTAPGSVAGMSIYCTVSDGSSPFANTGDFTIVVAPVGSTYTLTGGVGVANSSGTYSYSVINRSTGLLQISDSITGSSSMYVGFSTSTTGGYALKQITTGAFQIASFSVLDTTPPSVNIISPTAGEVWSNANFTISGTASDNVAVANVYYQLNGGGWHPCQSSNGWSTWAASVMLAPGTNLVQAYAVDTSGNVSQTISVSFIYALTGVLEVGETGLGTISPNYSNAVLQIGQSYSMTATPASGFSFTKWVVSTNGIGSGTVNNSTVQFVMQSNLSLQVFFADVTSPTLTISAPTVGEQVSNAEFTIEGTASDNWMISNVLFRINGVGWSLGSSTNEWTNWTAQVVLTPGTNSIAAYAVDTSGNVSATDTITFFYVAPPQNSPGCVPGPTGMVSWWPGDGTAIDIQGTNNGTAQGGLTYSNAEVGQGFSLNGANSFVQVPTSASLDLATQVSIVAWIRPNAFGTYNRFLDKHTTAESDGYLLDANNGKIRLVIGNSTLVGNTSIPLNAFSLVAGTFDGSTMKVYLNGTLDASLSSAISIPVNSLPLRIGSDSAGGNLFNGLVDEVMLFNVALTPAEIQSIFNAGGSGLCKGAGFHSITLVAGSEIQLKLGGRTGSTFVVEASSNLNSWIPLTSVFNTNGTIIINDTAVGQSERFYRVSAP